MNLFFPTIVGKFVRKISRLRGGGSALPGLVVEKIDPSYLSKSLQSLPYGTVVISGTNGKTTTTKIVVELLESNGLKVFTNKTGSNFTRGVIASMLGENDLLGNLNADIAILELDEAHAAHFIKQAKPSYSLLLNVMRDQLDRFGDTNYTASLLEKIALATNKKVIINSNDPHLSSLVKTIPVGKLASFGFDDTLADQFPSDSPESSNVKLINENLNISTLLSVNDGDTQIRLPSKNGAPKTYLTKLQLKGAYNALNATAAVALARVILKHDVSNQHIVSALSKIKPAFGRGEIVMLNGQPLEILLVKNPAGFSAGLRTFSDEHPVLIALNDAHADGRDLSWLWDVDFNTLKQKPEDIYLSGIRAYDMALRLAYEDMPNLKINTNIKKTLDDFLQKFPDSPKRIFCSYTAMLEIRRELGKITSLEGVDVK